jgi:hypothetical protein
MGGGVVLERGKHDELLSNEDGAYSRLVAAQRLREARDEINIGDVGPMGQESCEKAVESSADIEKAAMEEVPLGRRNTSRSLASEIIEQRKAQGSSKQEKEYSMFYLFKRMGRINRGEWKHYLLGTLFAIGKYFPFLGQPWPLTVDLQVLVLSSRLSVLFGVRKTWVAFSAWAGLTIPRIKQLRLSQASQTLLLRNAAMLVIATPFGELSPCIKHSHDHSVSSSMQGIHYCNHCHDVHRLAKLSIRRFCSVTLLQATLVVLACYSETRQ